jgi:hypothetical protein
LISDKYQPLLEYDSDEESMIFENLGNAKKFSNEKIIEKNESSESDNETEIREESENNPTNNGNISEELEDLKDPIKFYEKEEDDEDLAIVKREKPTEIQREGQKEFYERNVTEEGDFIKSGDKDRLKVYLMNLKHGVDPYFSDNKFHSLSKSNRNPKNNNNLIKLGYERNTKEHLNQKLHHILQSSLDISLSPYIKKIHNSDFFTK